MPRHRGRHRKSAGVPYSGARRNAGRNAKRRTRNRGGSTRMIRDVEELPANVDLAIIGAGPAGLAAAASSARLGLTALMLDENPNVGGQIYRAITSSPNQNHALLGTDYWRGEPLARE